MLTHHIRDTEQKKHIDLARFRQKERQGQTVLDGHYANGGFDDEILKANVSPDAVEPETGQTLLHVAVIHDFERLKAQGRQCILENAPTVKLLMEHFASPFIKNREGKTAFEVAAEQLLEERKDEVFVEIIQNLKNRELSRYMPYDFVHSDDQTIEQVRAQYQEIKAVLDAYGVKLKDRASLHPVLQYVYGYYRRLPARMKEWGESYHEYEVTAKDANITTLQKRYDDISAGSPRGLPWRKGELHSKKNKAVNRQKYDSEALRRSIDGTRNELVERQKRENDQRHGMELRRAEREKQAADKKTQEAESSNQRLETKLSDTNFELAAQKQKMDAQEQEIAKLWAALKALQPQEEQGAKASSSEQQSAEASSSGQSTPMQDESDVPISSRHTSQRFFGKISEEGEGEKTVDEAKPEASNQPKKPLKEKEREEDSPSLGRKN